MRTTKVVKLLASCHPERSEGSLQFVAASKIKELQGSFLRCTQDRLRLLRMTGRRGFLTDSDVVPHLHGDGISSFVESSTNKKGRRIDELRLGCTFKPLIARLD
jgi:hypothetical protein